MNERLNERLKELAREAGFYANPDVDKFEKFAQLIVQECTNILDIQGINTGQEAYHYGASLLEEYFGVES